MYRQCLFTLFELRWNGNTSTSKAMESYQEWNDSQLGKLEAKLNVHLSLEPKFAPFLITGTTWNKKTWAEPLQDFTDDPASTINAHTTSEKIVQLELLLSQIPKLCPVISRNTITKDSTSINNIWQSIRAHYGFQSTGAHFLDLINIQLKADDGPQDLYQRLMAFVDDSLLLTTSGLTHHGEVANLSSHGRCSSNTPNHWRCQNHASQCLAFRKCL